LLEKTFGQKKKRHGKRTEEKDNEKIHKLYSPCCIDRELNQDHKKKLTHITYRIHEKCKESFERANLKEDYLGRHEGRMEEGVKMFFEEGSERSDAIQVTQVVCYPIARDLLEILQLGIEFHKRRAFD
jgi:hypothetical protein